MKKINEILKDFREDNDLSQFDVAKYLKVPRSTYGHYETPNDFLGFSSDLAGTDISKIKKLCKFIEEENINIDKLLDLLQLIKNINK